MVAVVMVLPTNLVISIEGMQSGGEGWRVDGGGEPEGEQESGPGVWSHSVCPLTRGVPGRPLANNNNSS